MCTYRCTNIQEPNKTKNVVPILSIQVLLHVHIKIYIIHFFLNIHKREILNI